MSATRTFALPTLYPVIAAAAVAAFAFAVWSGEKYAPEYARAAAWASTALLAAAFVYELRRDQVTAARVTLVPALMVAIFGGGAFALGAVPAEDRFLACALAALPALAILALIARMQCGPDKYPNFVRQRFGRRAGEERGVQMGVVAPASLRTGEVGCLEVYLQNTWDAPRSATLNVGGTGAWRARYQSRLEVTLQALEVAVATIPVTIDESEVPSVRLAVELSVGGRGGRRRRLWRAPQEAHRRRLPSHFDRADAQFGRAGGLVISLPVTGAPVEPARLPETAVRLDWSPAEGPASVVR